jgi:dCMP deaminase
MDNNEIISWNKYFMEIAKLSAKRSKDPNTKVGACLVGEDNKIIGIGYNGFPRGCSDEIYPWTKPEKYLYVCHAELNALLNANNYLMIKGSILYSTLFPCNECAKIIIQLGVKKIIYLSDQYHDTIQMKASREMLDSANISYEEYKD